MRSQTDELCLLLIGKYSFHTEISNRTFRGPSLAAGFLANFTSIFLTYVTCSGLHLWPRPGDRLAEFAANEGKSSYLVV